MNRRTALAALAATALLVSVFPAFGDEGKWESTGTDDNVQTWKKEIEGSPVIAFKGTGVVDAPIAKVATILADIPRQTEWMDMCVEAKNLRQVDTFERIVYTKIDSPWPTDDRDFVTDSKMSFDDDKHVIKVSIHSVTEAGVDVPSGVVRGLISSSAFVLKSTGDGKTQVTAEIHADPRGDIPTFLVNTIQKGWARKTIKGIRKQAAKSDVVAADILTQRLDGKGY